MGMQVSPRIAASQQGCAAGYWLWCGGSMVVERGSDSGPLWQPNIWPRKMALRWTTRPYGGGCGKKVCGAESGSASNIDNGDNARRTSENWCSSTEVSTIGLKSGVHEDA